MGKVALEHLAAEDVRTLVRHPNAEKRSFAAQRICRTVRTVKLSDAERAFAHRLLDYMAKDAAAIVRRSLAITLKNSPELPRSVAKKLAADIDNIAIPVLTYSPVLTDEDLVDVLRSRAAAKIIAIAKRPVVSGTVVREIVRYGDGQAVAEVAANDGAIIDVETADLLLELYKDDDLIRDAFIARKDMPAHILEKLMTMVSEEAAVLMHNRHDIPVDVAVDLANRTRERATMEIVTPDLHDRELKLMIKQLDETGRLTPSFLIRAAGSGRIKLLQYSLSRMSNVSPDKTLLMIHDAGPLGLRALCQHAGLSDIDTKVIRAACVIYRDLEASGLEYDPAYFKTLMMERMLTLPIEMPKADQSWFLERLDGLEAMAA